MPDFAVTRTNSDGRRLHCAITCSLSVGRCATARVPLPPPFTPMLLSLVRRIRPSTIAAYVPVGSEPGGPDLPAVLAGRSSAAPAGAAARRRPGLGDAMTGTLTAGPRGLLEPPGPRLGVNAVQEARLVVVPALAVDRSGIRLGRGGGSYDRALARLSRRCADRCPAPRRRTGRRRAGRAHTTGRSGRPSPPVVVLTLSPRRRVDEMTSDGAPLALERL